MDDVLILPASNMGRGFIPKEFLPEGKDEYYLRNSQIPWPQNRWRHLREDEIEKLVRNGNTADSWDEVLVADPFEPQRIKRVDFFGLVRIGKISEGLLEYHDLRVQAGISDSVIVACDIGDDAAIHHVRYLAHYIIGDRCILLNVGEMHTTNRAKFGNGIVKDGEREEDRIWFDLINESGSRKIAPFEGMIPADAYLWAKYRDDGVLQEKLLAMTQSSFDSRPGYYGTVGNHCVVKNSGTVKDVKIGSHCYINGAHKLKNLTIYSSEEEPTRIGEGVDLVNGIIGYGCRIFYGSKAVRFISGNNSNVEHGARLINAFLGDNSRISGCEVQNTLIFPSHEQHHNNSFLIASVILGQSNLAAGTTIGSNHNSRANDGEVQAGRGFWPGLCSSIKHPCRFASFVLLSKADYPAQMDIPFPFSLLNNNSSADQLEVIPAFWWLYNMYALVRNAWKFQDRDKRKNKVQHIECDFLAPDTVEEIFRARHLLEVWTAKAHLSRQKKPAAVKDEKKLVRIGQGLLAGPAKHVDRLEILGERMEKSDRKVVILKAQKSYHAYGEMLQYYAVKNLVDFFAANPEHTPASMGRELQNERQVEWVNLGGQLVPGPDVAQLCADVDSGKLDDWHGIHSRYDALWHSYPAEKQKHAYATLCSLLGTKSLSIEQWKAALDRATGIQESIRDQVYISRRKDYDGYFSQVTYRNKEEMTAAIGTTENNSFIKQVQTETEAFRKRVEEIKKR
jgi:hypothetical protein